MIDPHQQRQAAREFQERWKDRGNERQDTAIFWLELLQRIFGVEHATEYIQFEGRVQLSNPSFIDAYIPTTKVLIEQKSKNVNLNQSYPQSDGAILSPYRQAKRYADWLRYSERPRWIVVSNFQEIHIHDQERPNADPQIVLLENLNDEFYRLNFLVDTEDDKIHKELAVSLQAGEIVGILYRALLDQYSDPEDEENLKDLNILCVRIVFCLYAEDAGLFGRRSAFRDFLQQYRNNPNMFRRALMDLFDVLDTEPEDRDLYISPELAAFPYVNGGLFEDKTAVIPSMSEEIIQIILDRASYDFDWSDISPTIFGSVFESTLNPESRREGGMHYTSIENIHKVIDPLFLTDLHSEFERIADMKQVNMKRRRLHQFQYKLGSLKFLDPACGSGNFLTETYLSLRRLENKVLIELFGQQVAMGDMVTKANPIKVFISQFYGIEVNDFAVSVANTALWISESQMLQETMNIVYTDTEFLPLNTSAHIEEGNALRMDWGDVVPKEELHYIMGNPPFVGARKKNATQSQELNDVFGELRGVGNLDYVAGWYSKAVEYIQNTDIEVCFVSTNSITQGQQVSILWKPFIEQWNIKLNFAYRTFKWSSEASHTAAVHVVIIGFSTFDREKKTIFDGGIERTVSSINPYLVEGANVFLNNPSKPLCEVPEMVFGSMPNDGGHLLLDENERQELIHRESNSEKYIRNLYGAEEFINYKDRYCLWLVNATPSELRNMPLVMERIAKVKEKRLSSIREPTRRLAETPHLFGEIRQPESDYLLVPAVSSENREYIPMGFMSKDDIATNRVYVIPEASLYDFGIMTSNVHMAWTRAVCGRLEMRYNYSATIVYNNFPWPDPINSEREQIKETAQQIIDVRELYPDSSLADLYDDLSMPIELRKAHEANDRVVMEAYGFNWRTMSEADIVAELMNLYQENYS